MAYPASTMRLGPTLEKANDEIIQTKAVCTARRQQMASGNVGEDVVLSLWQDFYARRSRLQSYAAVLGLAAYAQAQFGNAQLDIAAEFTAVLNAMTAVINNVASSLPVDGSGYLLREQFGAGVLTQRQWTPAQTATLQGLLQSLENTIA